MHTIRQLSVIRLADLQLYKLTRHLNYLRISWLMAIIMCAQALLPIQAHTLYVQDSNGQYTQICTLEGIKLVKIDGNLQVDPNSQKHYKHERPNAACSFSQLLSAALAADLSVHAQANSAPESHPQLFTDTPVFTTCHGTWQARAPPLV